MNKIFQFKFSFKKDKKTDRYPYIKPTGNEYLNVNLIPGSKYVDNKETYNLILRIKGNKKGLIFLAKQLLIIALLQDKKGFHIDIDQASGIIDKDSLDILVESNEHNSVVNNKKLTHAYTYFKQKRNRLFKTLSIEFYNFFLVKLKSYKKH